MTMSTLTYFLEYATTTNPSTIITNSSFNDKLSSNFISSMSTNLTKYNKILTKITNRPISIVPSTTSKYYHLYLKKDEENHENNLQNYNLSEKHKNHLQYLTTTKTSISSLSSSLPIQTVTDNILQKQFNYSSNNDTDILISLFGSTTTSSLESVVSLGMSTVTSSIDGIIDNNNNNNNSNNNISTLTTTSSSLIIPSDYLNLTWSRGCAVTVFLFLIFLTIIGNTLVILSVLTTRRLRTVTNCFVMNLAITDWLVGIFVMPPAVIFYIVGSWKFGWILCDVWISLDVLLCTASILSLCAISLDRYLAVIQPLTYSKKRRSKRLAMFMIFIVWIVAFSITCPPFLGWYEPGRQQSETVDCRYNQNKGYVVFSAMGSFFIPLTVMLYVYLNIGYVLTSRRHRINLTEASEKSPENDADCENFLTETEHIIHQCSPQIPYTFNQKNKNKKNHNDIISTNEHSDTGNAIERCGSSTGIGNGGGNGSTTLYELVEISRSSSLLRCSTISCKYSKAKNIGLTNFNNSGCCDSNINDEQIPMESIHFSQSHSSYTESNLTAAKFKINHHQSQQHQQQHQHHHHHHHHHHMHSNSTTIPSANNTTTIGKSHRVPPMRISTQKRDTKTAKTLTMVMGGFIICWLPFFTYYILIPFLPREVVSETLMSFLTWVGWVNCAINPFIYAFYNPDFRTAFWRLTFRRICKKPTNHLKLFKG